MDEQINKLKRKWALTGSFEAYQKYANAALGSGITPVCYYCAQTDSILFCACGHFSCDQCSALCAEPDCDSYDCPDCAESCPDCGAALCGGDHACYCLEEPRRNPGLGLTQTLNVEPDFTSLRLLVSRIAGSEQPEDWDTDLIEGVSPLSLVIAFKGLEETPEELRELLVSQSDAFSRLYISLVDVIRGDSDPGEELIPGHSAISLVNNFLSPTPEQLANIANLPGLYGDTPPPPTPPTTIAKTSSTKHAKKTTGRMKGDAEAREMFFEICLDHLIETGSIKSEDIRHLADILNDPSINIDVYRHLPNASAAENHRAANHRYTILMRLVKEGYAKPDKNRARDRAYHYTGKEKPKPEGSTTPKTSKKIARRSSTTIIRPPVEIRSFVEPPLIEPAPEESSTQEEFEPTYVWKGYTPEAAPAPAAAANGNLRGWRADRRPRVAIVGGEQLQRNIKGHKEWLEEYFDTIFVAIGGKKVSASIKQIVTYQPDLVIILSAFVQNDAISAITKQLPESAIVVTRCQQKKLQSITLARAGVEERGGAPWFLDAYDRAHRANPYRRANRWRSYRPNLYRRFSRLS